MKNLAKGIFFRLGLINSDNFYSRMKLFFLFLGLKNMRLLVTCGICLSLFFTAFAQTSLEKTIELYTKNKDKSRMDYEKSIANEKDVVNQVFDKEINRITRSGDLRAANELLAQHETWLKTEGSSVKNNNIESALEVYHSKKGKAKTAYEKTIAREQKIVNEAFELEIKLNTRNGDLRLANKVLAQQELWLKNEGLADTKTATNVKQQEKNDLDHKSQFKYALKFNSRYTYNNFPKNKLTVEKILCNQNKLVKGCKIKIQGTYNIQTHDSGKFTLISKNNGNVSTNFKKGAGDFEMEMDIVEIDELKISIYPPDGNGIGQISLSI